jgi:hypothetical protein
LVKQYRLSHVPSRARTCVSLRTARAFILWVLLPAATVACAGDVRKNSSSATGGWPAASTSSGMSGGSSNGGIGSGTSSSSTGGDSGGCSPTGTGLPRYAACVEDSCDCPDHCTQYVGVGSLVRTCAAPCMGVMDCLPAEYCMDGYCVPDYCGNPETLPDGGQNGSYDGRCYNGTDIGGTCFPILDIGTNSYTGACLRAGMSMTECGDLDGGVGCAPGLLCVYPTIDSDGGVCLQACDPTDDHGVCGAGQCVIGSWSVGTPNPHAGVCENQRECVALTELRNCTLGPMILTCPCSEVCAPDDNGGGLSCQKPCVDSSECPYAWEACVRGLCTQVLCVALPGTECGFSSPDAGDGVCVEVFDRSDGFTVCEPSRTVDGG